MTLAEQVVDLQTRIATAQRDRARAEGARDVALAAADTARAELKNTFGVTTVDEAHRLLTSLRTELETVTAEITAALDEIGL